MDDLTYIYNEDFFEGNLEDSYPTAKYLAPIIKEKLDLNTVVDIGCATGHWLKAFKEAGVLIYGIEGSSSAKKELLVDPKYVYFADLRQPLPIEVEDNYIDLLMSIEVAEHIESQYADIYVYNLTEVFRPKNIIMTAAPIGQGGKGHFNEQHQDYWIRKLQAHGYTYDAQLTDFLTIKVIEGRQWTDCPPELKAPNKPWAREHAHPTVKGYDGVWIPNWLPRNLMCYRRQGNEQ